MKWFILLSCLSWYHWFAIGLVEFLFVSLSTVILLLFFSLFFLLILDWTCFGVLSGVSSDELVKLSDEFSDSSSLPSVYKVSYLFWQFIGSFSILLGLQYFLCLTTSNFSVDFWSLRYLFWLSTSISIIVVFDLFSSIKSLFCSWRSSIISLLFCCSEWFEMSAMLFLIT